MLNNVTVNFMIKTKSYKNKQMLKNKNNKNQLIKM